MVRKRQYDPTGTKTGTRIPLAPRGDLRERVSRSLTDPRQLSFDLGGLRVGLARSLTDPRHLSFDLGKHVQRLLDVSLLQDVVPADALRGRVRPGALLVRIVRTALRPDQAVPHPTFHTRGGLM